jgi:hypothetical protein
VTKILPKNRPKDFWPGEISARNENLKTKSSKNQSGDIFQKKMRPTTIISPKLQNSNFSEKKFRPIWSHCFHVSKLSRVAR